MWDTRDTAPTCLPDLLDLRRQVTLITGSGESRSVRSGHA
jgi:hypothetical protein